MSKGKMDIESSQVIVTNVKDLVEVLNSVLQPMVEKAVNEGVARGRKGEVYKASEAAKILNVSRSQVYKLVKDKTLSSIGEGFSVRIPRSSIDNYLSDYRINGKY